MAAGVGAYQVSIFHLIMHAFFKALLFLCAGSVIHAMSDEQDMRKMGGIWRMVPITYVTMWIGSLALGGIPPFAGYFSKDAILEAAYGSGSAVGLYGFACGTIAAFLTAFYSGRLLFMTFHGAPRADAHTMEHVHESPVIMWGPLVALAVGAVAAGMWFEHQFIGAGQVAYWQGAIFNGPNNHTMEAMESLPFLVDQQPLVAGTAGFAVAIWFYIFSPEIPGRLAERFRPVYLFLLNKWYFDELYDAIFVRPAIWAARELWQVGDATIIDGVPNGLAALAEDGAKQVVRIQTGSIAVYAFTMLVGIVALVSAVLVIR